MDELTPRRRRLTPWVVGLVVVIINLPVVTHLLTQRSLERSGVDVQATLVDASSAGEGADADYGVAFRFDETIDPDQVIWTSEVDRATFQRATDTGTVAVRVLRDRPSAFRVDGAVTTRIGWYLTAVADVVLLVVAVALWRRGRARRERAASTAGPTDGPASEPTPEPAPEPAPEPVADPGRPSRPDQRPEPAPAISPMLRLEALEDVQRHVPELGSVGLEDLGGATYLVTGAVSRVAGDAVVVDTGEHHVLVSLGAHSNLVSPLQAGQVLARLPQGPSTRLPD